MSQNQAISDLRWALESPPLLQHHLAVDSEWGRLDLARNQGVFGKLSAPRSALHTAVRRRSSNRLGEYFETLIRVWIEEVPPATLLGANVQVHGKGGTVGEFDLLFERDDDVHHWELAVKFYLGYPGEHGQPAWIGPNPEDVWLEKWRRMRKHQLRLSRMKEGRRLLRRMGVRKQAHARALVKGWLFDPLDERYAVEDHPDTHPRAARGWWVHHGSLADFSPEIENKGAERWLRLRHDRWMSPISSAPADRLFASPGQLLSGAHPQRAHLVAGLAESADGWREVTRGFVVPDGWPNAG
jgi:hypothetical protein